MMENEDSQVYWKLLQRGNQITIACMQWFDEYDYDQSLFLCDEKGDQRRFDTEGEAMEFLNTHFPRERIVDEYFRLKYFLAPVTDSNTGADE